MFSLQEFLSFAGMLFFGRKNFEKLFERIVLCSMIIQTQLLMS